MVQCDGTTGERVTRFDMEIVMWSLVNWGRMRWIRQWLTKRCDVFTHGCGSRARTLSVNPSCRADQGILLICGSSWVIYSTVSLAVFSYYGYWRVLCEGTDWDRYIRRRCTCITRCLVYVSNIECSEWYFGRYTSLKYRLGCVVIPAGTVASCEIVS